MHARVQQGTTSLCPPRRALETTVRSTRCNDLHEHLATFASKQVLAPSLQALSGLEILLQYGGMATNVCFEEVLRCALATQVRDASF